MRGQNTSIVEAIKEILKTYGYYICIWHVDDIHFICEQNNLPRLNDDEAMEVFSVAADQFDGENGISWPQLESALHIYLHQRALLNELCESAS